MINGILDYDWLVPKAKCDIIFNLHISTFICTYILTGNENASPKYTSKSQGYMEYTFTEDFW